jgi:putative redox protein
MLTSKVKYLGNLRTESVHVKSGIKIITDAPVDNNGQGSSFSPTDLVATSYASCMITIMGIYCNENNIEFNSAEASILKIMGSNPRRISRIEVEMNLKGNNWDEKTAQKIINIGKNCPVAKTLGDNVEVIFNFIN